MKIAILGAGAVGGYYGGRLAQHGHDVHFLYHTEYAAVRARGLTLRSVHGDWSGPVQAYQSVHDMPVCDVAILGFKSAQRDLMKELLPVVLGDSGVALCLMNGLGNEEILAEVIGQDRVLAGAAFICAEREEPGVVRHFAVGGLSFAPYWLPAPPALVQVQKELTTALEKSHVSCAPSDDGRLVKWSKLVWNVPFSGLSLAMGGVTTDVILATESNRTRVRALMADVLRAAHSEGVTIDPNLPEINFRQTEGMGAYRPSMLVDFEKGRPTEWEAIVREPLLRAQRAGIAVPAIAELAAELERLSSQSCR
jgi:2-dehydropantoate 2-reductase